MRMRSTGPALVIETPAKLNLHLSVLGRRPDGFHELETVMVSVGLYDTLTFYAAPADVELSCSGLNGALPADDSNLVLRAARLLASTTGCRQGAKIQLHKRIPMQAGMGGGSSNAAATLCGLNELWRLGLTSGQLHELAAQLGSDVNFFLDSEPLAVCRGRGERVEAKSLRGPLWMVIAKPQVGLSTSAVFKQLALSDRAGRDASRLLDACGRGAAGEVGDLLLNDLERPSRELSRDLSNLLDSFGRIGLPGVRMTGSGSACFGVALNREQAGTAARRLRQLGMSEVFVVRTAV